MDAYCDEAADLERIEELEACLRLWLDAVVRVTPQMEGPVPIIGGTRARPAYLKTLELLGEDG